MTEAILLSAGRSSRMGEKNKLLLDYDGRPMIQNAIDALSVKKIDRIIVITGHDHKAISELLQDQEVEIVYNPLYLEGMVTSIQAGLKALDSQVNEFLIMLGDMPLIKSIHIVDLIEFGNGIYPKSKPYILRPTWQEQKGHPVIFSSHFIDPILACDNKHSLQSVIKMSKERFFEYRNEDEAFYRDIDTLIEYRNLTNA